MDARPLYLRLLGETMEVLTRGGKHITSATRSSFSPRVTQKPLTLSRSAVLEWKAILGTEIPSAVSGSGTRKHEGDSGWDAAWREGWDRLEFTAAATRATMPEIIGYGMGGIPHGDRASGHRAAGRLIVRPTSRPRGLGKSSSLQTCALWLLWVTKRRAVPR